MAQQMAAVGIVPSKHLKLPGYRFVMAGQPFTVTGLTNKQEFVDAVKHANLPMCEAANACPDDFYFLRVSTD